MHELRIEYQDILSAGMRASPAWIDCCILYVPLSTGFERMPLHRLESYNMYTPEAFLFSHPPPLWHDFYIFRSTLRSAVVLGRAALAHDCYENATVLSGDQIYRNSAT